MNEISVASWSVRDNGDGTVSCENIVNGSTFSGTITDFNYLIKQQVPTQEQAFALGGW